MSPKIPNIALKLKNFYTFTLQINGRKFVSSLEFDLMWKRHYLQNVTEQKFLVTKKWLRENNVEIFSVNCMSISFSKTRSPEEKFLSFPGMKKFFRIFFSLNINK